MSTWRLEQVVQFNIALDINVKEEKINVDANAPTLDVNPANNASAIVLSGKDLEALPTTPMSYWPICKRWPGLRPAPMAGNSTSMDSPPASFRQSHRFAKFALTRTRLLTGFSEQLNFRFIQLIS